MQPAARSSTSRSRSKMRASSPPPSIVPKSVPIVVPPLHAAREVELEAEVFALRSEIAGLLEELASARERFLESCEPEIVRLAVAVAEKVVARELSLDPAMV